MDRELKVVIARAISLQVAVLSKELDPLIFPQGQVDWTIRINQDMLDEAILEYVQNHKSLWEKAAMSFNLRKGII